ncbi:MAG: hypothetical protein K2I64_04620 [Muribaculaceae bacterium]|nr:hypothetical protein [Muribaculaceae bacterium]
MKKTIFALVLAFSSFFSGTAQDVSVKYQGEVDLGYSVGVGTFSQGRVNLHTVQGVKISDYFSTGLGLGLDYYHDLYSNVGSGELFIPIFLNMKGYIPVTSKLSPFVSLDLGYGIGATEGVSGCGGFLWSPSIGVRYSHFQFQIGYTSQRISESGIGFNMDAVQFKIGFVF